MKRHAALQDLSRDHQLMLMQARHIRWLEEGHPRASSFEEVRAGLLAFWQSDGEWHLLEEERVLLSALTMPALQPLLLRVHREHADLRRAIAQLQARPDAQSMFAFGRRLHDHVRWEERELFEQAQLQLNEAQLLNLSRRSQEFRSEHSRPIGPFGAACATPVATNSQS